MCVALPSLCVISMSRVSGQQVVYGSDTNVCLYTTIKSASEDPICILGSQVGTHLSWSAAWMMDTVILEQFVGMSRLAQSNAERITGERIRKNGFVF